MLRTISNFLKEGEANLQVAGASFFSPSVEVVFEAFAAAAGFEPNRPPRPDPGTAQTMKRDVFVVEKFSLTRCVRSAIFGSRLSK